MVGFPKYSHNRTQHLHLAPEVIDGVVKQSTTSDMYSVGKVLECICDKHENVTEEEKHYISKLKSVAERCTSDKFFSRPPAFRSTKRFSCLTYMINFMINLL